MTTRPSEGPYKGWYRDSWSGWVFIHPANDLWGHLPYSSDCPCRPEIDSVHLELIHHAYDGRDLIEAVQRGDKII